MLQKIRDRASGPLAWVIVGIISVPFAFFGIEAFRTDPGAAVEAVVGDEEITEFQVSRQYDQRYQQLQDMLGENFRADFIDPEQLRENVLDSLVQGAVMRQHLAETGYRVSDERVLDFIRSQEAFQVDGAFSPDRYREILGRQGQAPVDYEDRVREYLASEQFRTALSDSHFLAPGELAEKYRLEQQTREVAWRQYSARKLAEGVEISEDEILARYDERKDSLKAPERVRLEYLELSRSELTEGLEPGEEALRAIYEAEKASRFTIPEERSARHILVRIDEDTDAQAAGAKLDEYAARIAAGEEFAAVAKEVSEDPGSKEQGGSLGWVRRGVMVPPFEEALFALSAGEVSEPVLTDFGWHLIQLEEIRAERTQAYDDPGVAERVLALYRDREGRRLMQEKGEVLSEQTFENPSSLQPAAEALGLEIKTTEWFTRGGGAGIAADDSVVEAAFSDVVLNARENSQVIALGDRQLVVRLLEHEPERQQTLDEVRADLERQLRNEAGRRLAKEAADADIEALIAQQKSWDDLESGDAVTVKDKTEIMRTDRTVSRPILGRAFELARPNETPIYSSVELPGGDAVVLALHKVTDGDWAAAAEEAREELANASQDAAANREYNAIQALLRDAADVRFIEAEDE